MEHRLSTWLTLLLLAACLTGCRREPEGKEILPATPEQALAQLATAARRGDAAQLYGLLDNQSRWSIMSIERDTREICRLVRQHYPRDRQARELQRCPSAAAKDTRAFFVPLAAAHALLQPLTGIAAGGRRVSAATGDAVEIESRGVRLPLCRERETLRDGWTYCGLRAALERLKVKTARDLITVKENAETFKGR